MNLSNIKLSEWSKQCIENYQNYIDELEEQNRDYAKKIMENLEKIEINEKYINEIILTSKEAI